MTACSSVASSPAARRTRRGSSRATSSSPPAASPIPDIDDLHELLGNAGLPLEVTLVRGTEERTVTVAAVADEAAGEESLVN